MRFRGLFSGLLAIVGALLIAVPAEATRLLNWQFDQNQNRLVFTTDDGVQPRAQLIMNPTRVVIDLPGTTLGRSRINQPIGTGIREVRIGQFDAQTTRIVIELSPGYTLDPNQVEVRGATPNQWSVQLPPLLQVDARSLQNPPASSTTTTPVTPVVDVGQTSALNASTQLENVRVTPDGFFIRTSGDTPEIEVERSRDREELTIDLEDTALAPQLVNNSYPIERYGVNEVSFSQPETSPPVARITFDMDEESPDWQASVSNLGGVVLVPIGGIPGGAIANTSPESVVPENNEPEPPAIATIQSVSLSSGNLVVQADQPLSYDSGWDPESSDYRIVINNARLAQQVSGPDLGANSPLLRVRLRQDSDDSVTILVRPAAGTFIGDINQPSRQILALQLQSSTAQTPIPIAPPSGLPVQLPSNPSGPLPTVRDGRVLVVIDPGHGGPDPGAVGIGGLRETSVVLPISLQVAALLEQNGVQALLTRQSEYDLDLDPRVQLAERADADLFVSIHANAISMSRPDVNGVETYYYSNAGLQLARAIHSSMLQGTGRPDRGVRQARFYVLVHTSMPAVLVETGFVTGRDDAPLLADPGFQRRMAESISRGILQYIQQYY